MINFVTLKSLELDTSDIRKYSQHLTNEAILSKYLKNIESSKEGLRVINKLISIELNQYCRIAVLRRLVRRYNKIQSTINHTRLDLWFLTPPKNKSKAD